MLDRFLLALTLAVSPFAAAPTAQCGVEELEVVGTGPKDFLGTSVALRNDLAVIGAREGFPTSKSPTGHADVYRYGPTGWAFEQQLPQTTGMQFGAAVDTDGTNIVVGAPLGIVSFPQIEIFSYDGSA
jgi:hypothetical protein